MSPLAVPSPSTGMASVAQTSQPSTSQGQPQAPLARVDTHDLKSKLALALGNNGRRYWQAFVSFCTANISRDEFEEEANACLKAQHVHLHNALVFGILYNATSGVPGPSSVRHHPGLRSSGRRDEYGELVDPNEDDEDPYDLFSPRKRLRTLVAGLSKKERKRLKGLAKAPGQRGAGGSAGGNLGWAGAGADMLEKKRKDEERRRTAEEKRRFREAYTEIGKPDWREGALRDLGAMRSSYEMAPASVQRSIAKALTLPLCAEAKHLPDADSLRDTMTLQAVEAGLPNGAHPQAAALLLAALQDHLQNIASSVIAKVRSNRQHGIRTDGPDLPASVWPPAAHEAWVSTKSSSTAAVAVADVQASADQGDDMDVDGPAGVVTGADVSMGSPAIRLETLGDETNASFGEASVDATDLLLRPNPTRRLRNVASDLSARSTASALAPSLADTSAVSFVSTAPTSVHGGRAGSDVGSRTTDKGDSSMHSSNAADESLESIRQGKRRRADDSDGEEDGQEERDVRGVRSHPSESTPARILRDTDLARAAAARAMAQRSIALDDMDFLLDVAPHTVVEPLGQAPQDRFMTPPFERLGLSGQSDDDDDDLVKADPAGEEDEELVFRREIRLLAYRKMTTPPPSALSLPPPPPPSPPQSGAPRPSISGALAEHNVNLNPHRARRLLDQSAPLKLLDRRSLAEERTQARSSGARPTKSGLSLGVGQHQPSPEQERTGPFAGPAGSASPAPSKPSVDHKMSATSPGPKKGPSAFMPSSASSAVGGSSAAGGDTDGAAPHVRKLGDSLWDVVDLHDFFGPNV